MVLHRARSAVSDFFRSRRHRWGLEHLLSRSSLSIIDIGGTPDFWLPIPFQGSVVCVNLDAQPVASDARIRSVQGDACDLRQFRDGEFDLAVSNSLIEHVGGWKEQERAAHETRRVARAYYVQTPNRAFPIEPHFVCPVLQHLAGGLQGWVASWWPLGFVKGSAAARRSYLASVRLLSEREMRVLFPEAVLSRERLGGLTKSFVAIHAPADSLATRSKAPL